MISRLQRRARHAVERLRRLVTDPVALDPLARNVGRIVRLTAAAVIAYLFAKLATPDLTDLTGPLTALIVVQASLFGSLRSGLGRVGAVLTGVVVALGLGIWFGLTWWSLGLAIAISLVLAHAFRLGDHILETPISSMLVLGVAQHDVAAQTRILNTLIGAGVGMAFNLLVPPSVESRTATSAVGDVARDLAYALRRAGTDLEEGFERARVQSWLDDVHRVLPRVTSAEEEIAAHAELRRFNPRSVGARDDAPFLRSALRALDAATLAVRALLVALIEEAPEAGENEEEATVQAVALQGALGAVMELMSDGLVSYGTYVTTAARGDEIPAAQALEQTLDTLRETRAMLTELLLVDPEHESAAWLLRGGVLGGVDRFLSALDADGLERTERRRRAPGAAARRVLRRPRG